MRSETFQVDTRGKRVHDLTAHVERFAAEVRGDGLLLVFLPHATAGVALMETGSGSERDLDELLERTPPSRRPVRAPARAGGPRRRPSAAGARVALARVAGDRGRLQLGVAIRRVDRPEPRERRQDRATQLRAGLIGPSTAQRYWPGVRSSAGAADTACTSRSRSRVRSSPSISTSRPEEGRKSTRSPSLATRTSGPTSATSPQARRLGAGAAVAGISSPPALLRSPFSGARTTRRSPSGGSPHRSPSSWSAASSPSTVISTRCPSSRSCARPLSGV